jgi:hypothetical protein
LDEISKHPRKLEAIRGVIDAIVCHALVFEHVVQMLAG